MIPFLYQTDRFSQRLFSADIESEIFLNAQIVTAYLSRLRRSSSIASSLITVVALSFSSALSIETTLYRLHQEEFLFITFVIRVVHNGYVFTIQH
jgi:hypothetical protein